MYKKRSKNNSVSFSERGVFRRWNVMEWRNSLVECGEKCVHEKCLFAVSKYFPSIRKILNVFSPSWGWSKLGENSKSFNN
jgi:hypothetical protein